MQTTIHNFLKEGRGRRLHSAPTAGAIEIACPGRTSRTCTWRASPQGHWRTWRTGPGCTQASCNKKEGEGYRKLRERTKLSPVRQPGARAHKTCTFTFTPPCCHTFRFRATLAASPIRAVASPFSLVNGSNSMVTALMCCSLGSCRTGKSSQVADVHAFLHAHYSKHAPHQQQHTEGGRAIARQKRSECALSLQHTTPNPHSLPRTQPHTHIPLMCTLFKAPSTYPGLSRILVDVTKHLCRESLVQEHPLGTLLVVLVPPSTQEGTTCTLAHSTLGSMWNTTVQGSQVAHHALPLHVLLH